MQPRPRTRRLRRRAIPITSRRRPCRRDARAASTVYGGDRGGLDAAGVASQRTIDNRWRSGAALVGTAPIAAQAVGARCRGAVIGGTIDRGSGVPVGSWWYEQFWSAVWPTSLTSSP